MLGFFPFLISLLEERSLLDVRDKGGEGAARNGRGGGNVGEARGVFTVEAGRDCEAGQVGATESEHLT